MARSHLGIQRIHSLEITVRDATPWLAYFAGALGFQETAASTEPVSFNPHFSRRISRIPH